MASPPPSAATRVGENSLIMSEIFSHIEAKKDLLRCMVSSKDSFLAGLRWMFTEVDEGLIEKIKGRGCPTLNQYTSSVTSIVLRPNAVSVSKAVDRLRLRYPTLNSIAFTYYGLCQPQVSGWIHMSTERVQGHHSIERQRIGWLDFSVSVSLPIAAIPHAIMQLWRLEDHLQLRRLTLVGSGPPRWDRILACLGLQSTSIAAPTASARLHTVEDLNITCSMPLQDFEDFLAQFPSMRRFRAVWDVYPNSYGSRDIASLISSLERSTQYRLQVVEVRIVHANIYLKDREKMLQAAVAIGQSSKLCIQHCFDSSTYISSVGIPLWPPRTTPDRIDEVCIYPLWPSHKADPITTARWLKAGPLNASSIRLGMDEQDRLYNGSLKDLLLRWIQQVNQHLRELELPSGSIGFRKLENDAVVDTARAIAAVRGGGPGHAGDIAGERKWMIQ